MVVVDGSGDYAMKIMAAHCPLNTTTSRITAHNQAGPVMAPLVLKVPEFATRYRVSKRTVWTWLKNGLPHLKLSRRKTLIPVAEADRWVNENFMRQRER